MLMTHYREPIDFSVRRLEEAENVLARLWRRGAEARGGDFDGFVEALCDDLDTPGALATLASLSGPVLHDALALAGLPGAAPDRGVDEVRIAATISLRLQRLGERNFAEADRIRADLLAEGIQLMDYKDPATGERKTRWEARR
jgi:cysteinyl-tRNA synthetase